MHHNGCLVEGIKPREMFVSEGFITAVPNALKSQDAKHLPKKRSHCNL